MDALATLTTITAITSFIVVISAERLWSLVSTKNKQIDSIVQIAKYIVLFWGFINSIGLFATIREDLNDYSCNAFFILANGGSHGINAFVEIIWMYQVFKIYRNNAILRFLFSALGLFRVCVGISDTWLGIGYIDPVLGCAFIQNQTTGTIYEFLDLAIDIITSGFLIYYILNANGNAKSANAANGVYLSIVKVNMIRNIVLTSFNIALIIILFQDPLSPVVVPMFQIQLVLMMFLTLYETEIRNALFNSGDASRKQSTVAQGQSAIAQSGGMNQSTRLK